MKSLSLTVLQNQTDLYEFKPSLYTKWVLDQKGHTVRPSLWERNRETETDMEGETEKEKANGVDQVSSCGKSQKNQEHVNFPSILTWRNGSAVKSIGCSSRGTDFISQHWYRGLQPSATSVPVSREFIVLFCIYPEHYYNKAHLYVCLRTFPGRIT